MIAERNLQNVYIFGLLQGFLGICAFCYFVKKQSRFLCILTSEILSLLLLQKGKIFANTVNIIYRALLPKAKMACFAEKTEICTVNYIDYEKRRKPAFLEKQGKFEAFGHCFVRLSLAPQGFLDIFLNEKY